MARKRRKGRRKGKFLKKARGSFKNKLGKSATLKSVKPYAKAGFALTATGLAYATTYTVAKGVGQAIAPNATYKTDSWLTNTDLGLLTQTGLIVGSTGLAIKFLDSGFGKKVVPNFFSRFKDEKKIMIAGSTAFATGRLMTGLSYKNLGKRFQALFDADLPAAVFTGQGPYFNRPSNIRAMNEVIRGNPDNPSERPRLTDRFFNLFSPKYGSWVAGRDPADWSTTRRVNIPSGINQNFNYMNFKTNRPPFPNNATAQQQNVNQTPGQGDGMPSTQIPTVNTVSANNFESTTSPGHKFKNWNNPHPHFWYNNKDNGDGVNIWRSRTFNNLTPQEHNALHQNGYSNLDNVSRYPMNMAP